MSKTKKKPKEASRVLKNQYKGYCSRKDCTQWAVYHVFDRKMNNVGGYCRDCSEFLVHALNSKPEDTAKSVDVASLFPPL